MPSSRPTKTSSSSASERSGARTHAGEQPAIALQDITLRFIRYNDKYYSLKRAMIDLVLHRDDKNSVTEFWALQGVSLTVWPGERLGIIGANGAGKSTLLRVLAKIYPPTAGKLVVRGSIAPLIEMGAGMNGELSGADNIYLNGALLGFTRQQMRDRVDQIWEFSGLREFADLPLKYYSSGMYSRLAFAIATEVEPEILLIDEALSAGDAAFLDRAKERMHGLFGRSKAVVLVSHDMKSMNMLCTRVVWLHRGRVIADGPVDEVTARYSEFMRNGCDPAMLEAASAFSTRPHLLAERSMEITDAA